MAMGYQNLMLTVNSGGVDIIICLASYAARPFVPSKVTNNNIVVNVAIAVR